MDDDLIQALTALLTAPDTADGYMTTTDLAEAMGIDPDVVRARLKLLIQRGEIERGRVYRETIAGYYQRFPGYKFKAGTDNKD